MNANDAAFPYVLPSRSYTTGLSKREYFASLFLQGFIASNTNLTFNERVVDSINYADQLIYELSKPKESA